MNITCPNCAASYHVGASAIGAEGRSVRCVRCRTVWFQEPKPEVPALDVSPDEAGVRQPASDATVAAFEAELGAEIQPPAEAPQAPAENPQDHVAEAPPAEAAPPAAATVEAAATEPASAADPQAAAEQPAPGMALSEITIPAAEAPPTAPEDQDAAPATGDEKPSGDIESIAARRKPRSRARRKLPTRAGRIPVLILLLVGACAALIGWRTSIVRHVPQLASLYAAVGMPVNLRGLIFTDVKVSRDTHEGVQILLVEGNIVSVASKPVEVPRLRFAMRSEGGSEVYAWTAMPSREALAPGETLPFRSRLASPPGEGRDVMVRFFTRLDAVAGLR